METAVNGIIRFQVTSDGTTGAEWIIRLEKAGFKLKKHTKELLLSKEFKPTLGITYEIALLKGSLFADGSRISKNIRDEAAKRKFATPNPEVACLIREKFSDDEINDMGLYWIVTFHNQIKDYKGDLGLLATDRGVGGSELSVSYIGSDLQWILRTGFAFVVSQ